MGSVDMRNYSLVSCPRSSFHKDPFGGDEMGIFAVSCGSVGTRSRRGPFTALCGEAVVAMAFTHISVRLLTYRWANRAFVVRPPYGG